MNIVKTKLRNKMQLPMLKAILSVKHGLKRNNKCCKNYDLPPSTLKLIGTMAAYDINKKDNENIEQVNEEDYEDIIALDDIIAHSSL